MKKNEIACCGVFLVLQSSIVKYCASIFLIAITLTGSINLSDVIGPKLKSHLDLRQNSTKSHESFAQLFRQYNYIVPKNITVEKNYGPRRKNMLRFLHIPKTGTTFAATVTHYCCNGLDNTFVDVIMPFNTIIPKVAFKILCANCLKQPRSRNGDPWAHIPYRRSVDANHSIAIFRNPDSRLASQLYYSSVLGPELSVTFGYRWIDSNLIVQLLRNRITLIETALRQLLRKRSETISDYYPSLQHIYDLASLKKLSYQNSLFRSKTRECLDLARAFIGRNASLRFNMTTSGKSFHHNILINSSIVPLNNSATEMLSKFSSCCRSAVVLYPGLKGCQTKMILGRNCFDIYEISDDDMTEAKRRLSEEFLFVGR